MIQGEHIPSRSHLYSTISHEISPLSPHHIGLRLLKLGCQNLCSEILIVRCHKSELRYVDLFSELYSDLYSIHLLFHSLCERKVLAANLYSDVWKKKKITLWLCQNSYGTSPFFMGKSTIDNHFP